MVLAGGAPKESLPLPLTLLSVLLGAAVATATAAAESEATGGAVVVCTDGVAGGPLGLAAASIAVTTSSKTVLLLADAEGPLFGAKGSGCGGEETGGEVQTENQQQ